MDEPVTAPPRSRRRLALAAAGLVGCWLLVGAVVGTGVLASGGELARLRVMTVLTGSMRPTLGVGDLVVAQVVPAKELESGDIVTFRDPEADRYITHRVQSVVWRGQLGDVITRGDANNVGENWAITADGSVGRVAVHVPYLGYAVGALGSVAGRLSVTAAAVLLGAYTMLLIWRPRRMDITATLVEQLALFDRSEPLSPEPAGEDPEPAPEPPDGEPAEDQPADERELLSAP